MASVHSVLIQLLTVSHRSLLCPSNTHWSAKQEREWEQLALALSHVLRARASCQSSNWADPGNIVGILPDPGPTLRYQPTAGYRLILGHRSAKVTAFLRSRREVWAKDWVFFGNLKKICPFIIFFQRLVFLQETPCLHFPKLTEEI